MPVPHTFTQRINSTTGSTLIEVLIATMVVVFVLVALAESFTLVLRNQRSSTGQEQATKYAQQAIEWIRSVRDTSGWQDFYTAVNADSTHPTHCIPTMPATADIAAYQALSDVDCNTSLPANAIQNEQAFNSYFRKLVVTASSADNITAVATVSWIEGTRTLDSQITLVLRKWAR